MLLGLPHMVNFVDLTLTRSCYFSWVLPAEKTKIRSLGTYVSLALESSTHPRVMGDYPWVESGPTLLSGTRTLVSSARAGRGSCLSSESHLPILDPPGSFLMSLSLLLPHLNSPTY